MPPVDYLELLRAASLRDRESRYRTVLRALFALVGRPGPDAEVARLLVEEVELASQLCARADTIRHDEIAQWRRNTGTCPLCGDGADSCAG